jgi:Resolvase, N terminal domain
LRTSQQKSAGVHTSSDIRAGDLEHRHPLGPRLVGHIAQPRGAINVAAEGLSGLCATLPAMTKIGYARVSTRDQDPQAQLDALERAGCERVFTDHGASGRLAAVPRSKVLRAWLPRVRLNRGRFAA